MQRLRQNPLASAAAIALAAVTGTLVAQPSLKTTALLGVFMACAMIALTLEAPIVAYGALALILALASEERVDDRLGLTGPVYGTSLGGISIPLALTAVLVFALGVQKNAQRSRWPGAPITVLAMLVGVAIFSSVLAGSVTDNLFVVRPLFILLLASLGGYWVTQQNGVDLPLKVLVAAAGIAFLPGLYNSFSTGNLSYYDASYIYLIGTVATLVLFRAVDIGVIRIPFVLLSALVIMLSFRRGAMLAVAVTLVVTGLVSGRVGFRASVWLILASALVIELVSPGSIYGQIERLATYFTGSTGQDENVNYRKYETANAWLNVKEHPVWGIGPTADWIVYRTFDGRFRALGTDYLHNSYLWVWLRYSVVGLVLFIAFLATSAIVLIRRSSPIVSLAVGASMLGLAVTLVTGSSLTTTTRWPLIVGLMLGIALAAGAERDLPSEHGRFPAGEEISTRRSPTAPV